MSPKEAAAAFVASAAVHPRNRLRLWTAIASAVLIFAVAGYYAVHAGEETTDNAQVGADVIAVPARTRGVLVEIVFKDNQHVEEGDVLAKLDSSVQKARLIEADAELESAKYAAEAAEAEAGVVATTARGNEAIASAAVSGSGSALSSANSEIARANALVESALAEYRSAQTMLERMTKLYERQAETKQRMESAQSAFSIAEANLAAAKAQRALARSARGMAKSSVAEANARLGQSRTVEAQIARAEAQKALALSRVRAAEAARDLAAIDLEYTTIVAPRSGIVSNRTVSVGQMIQAGQPIVSIVSSESVWVTANFKETQVGRMRPGQKARLLIDAYKDREMTGKVLSLSGGTGATFSLLPPENATGNFSKVVQRIPVRIAIDNLTADTPLRVGMSVVATVDVSEP